MSALVKINDELQVEVVVDPQHEWLLSTKDVAEGYGLSVSAIQKYKDRYSNELVEGKHWVLGHPVSELGGRPGTMWTKRGVIRIGFMVNSEIAREFRDWAEDYIIDGGPKVSTPAIPQTFAQALALAAEQALKLELQAPKVEVYDAFMDPDVIPTLNLREVAKELGYSQKVFFTMLRRDNIIFLDSSCPKSPYDQKGYFKSTNDVKNGRVITSWRVTPSGLEFFFRKYGKKEV